MHWNTKRTARVICRRSIIVALAAIVAVGSTAGSLLAAGPLKPKSRVAIEATTKPSGHPAASLSSPPPVEIIPPQTTPSWFPEAPPDYAPGSATMNTKDCGGFCSRVATTIKTAA